MDFIQDRIKDYFDTTWDVSDFKGTYMDVKGIENRELTADEEKKFDSLTNVEALDGIRQAVIEDVHERIRWLFK